MAAKILNYKTQLLLACLTAFSLGANAAQRVDEQIFEVDADARLDLNIHRADVRIRTADVDTIQITATISHDDEDALDLLEIDMSGTAKRVRVKMNYDQYDGWRWGWNDWSGAPYYPDVDLDIVIPETISLDIQDHRSTMEITAPSGEIRIDSHRGRGDITGIRSDFALDTHRGNFELEVASLRDLDIKTHRGDVDVEILEGDDFDLRGESHRGRLIFRGMDIEVERDRHESRVSHRSGNGEYRIDLDTHRGDIRLDFEG